MWSSERKEKEAERHLVSFRRFLNFFLLPQLVWKSHRIRRHRWSLWILENVWNLCAWSFKIKAPSTRSMLRLEAGCDEDENVWIKEQNTHWFERSFCRRSWLFDRVAPFVEEDFGSSGVASVQTFCSVFPIRTSILLPVSPVPATAWLSFCLFLGPKAHFLTKTKNYSSIQAVGPTPPLT